MENVATHRHPKICIIGAGFSGLCAAIQFQQKLGLNSFTIFDENKDVGGTWLVNTYPGCACDIPSHLYSLSFEPNPLWSKAYAGQEEILSYIRAITDKHELRQHIKFQHKVVEATWKGSCGKWMVTTVDLLSCQKSQADFDILVTAVGAYRLPIYPPEFETFSGPKMHSFRWDHSIELNDKVVAVIGSGASAVQLIPEIVDNVKRLISYQRRPAWVIPKVQYYFPTPIRRAFQRLPVLQNAFRKLIFWSWDACHHALKLDSLLNILGVKLAQFHLFRQIRDPDLREKLTPNYAFGCKFITPSNDFYPALAKKNVKVISKSEIVRVTEDSIFTEDGSCEKPDLLILATGFKVQDLFAPLKITGKDGVDLLKKWKTDGVCTYLGTVCHHAPNLFYILGPNTALAHISVLLNIEAQVDWMIKVVREVMMKNAQIVTVRKCAEDDHMDKIAEALKSQVYGTSKCGSYFVDGRGTNFGIWPGAAASFLEATQSVIISHFEFS